MQSVKMLIALLIVVQARGATSNLRGGSDEIVARHLAGTFGFLAEDSNGQPQEVRESGSFECLLVVEDRLYPKGVPELTHESEWCCQDENLLIYKVEGRDSDFFKANNGISGHSNMWVSKAEKVRNSHAGNRIKIAADSKVHIFRADRRRLAPKTGINSVLVIRGTSRDGAPTNTAAQLADDVFGVKGGGTDLVNFVTQYNACSKGALQYKPATGSNIQNGVAEVYVNYALSGVDSNTAHNYFINAAPSVVGSLSQWTQVMVVMQSTVNFNGAAAYAYINHWLSVYMDGYASQVMVQMHELGHNLGMYHSGEGAATYLDHTCMMGNPQYDDDTPIQCFNGAKSWFFGWYANHHKTVTPTTSSWDGLVAGINDYVQNETRAGNHYVVVKIDDTSSSTDLYMMYNKKEGVNSGVVMSPDLVTIVSASNGVASDQSWLVASLNATQVYRAPNFSGQQYDLVVEVCDMVAGTPDYARVLVYLDNGVGKLNCSTSFTFEPTPAPTTAQPTPAPTPAQPTRPPTPAPTKTCSTLSAPCSPTAPCCSPYKCPKAGAGAGRCR